MFRNIVSIRILVFFKWDRKKLTFRKRQCRTNRPSLIPVTYQNGKLFKTIFDKYKSVYSVRRTPNFFFFLFSFYLGNSYIKCPMRSLTSSLFPAIDVFSPHYHAFYHVTCFQLYF